MIYQRIVSELLLAIKGSRSSVELSKAMGYSFNQVKRWETGEKQLRWDEFCSYCATLDVPLSSALVNVFQYDHPDPLKFLGHLHSNKFPLHSLEILSEKLHRHPSAIRRYIDGEIFPDLEFVLAFMDLDVNRLAMFVLALVPPGCASPLLREFESERNKLSCEAEMPIAAAIEGWLVTETYRKLVHHDDEFLAQRVGCSAEEVQRILNNMVAAETLFRNDKGKYCVGYDAIDMSGLDPKLLSKFFRFWFQRAAQHYSHGEITNRGSVRGTGTCRIVPVSRKASQEINEIMVRADAEIRSVIANIPDTEVRNDVRVILLKSFSTQDF